MSKFLVEALDQKFELHQYRVYFGLQNGGQAEEILDALDRAATGLQAAFGLDGPPCVELYLYPDLATIERVTQRPMTMGETVRILPGEGAIMLAATHLPPLLGPDVVRHLGYLLFDGGVHERDIGIRTLRTPSWLREGLCMQVPAKIRRDSKEYLIEGWNTCREALKAEHLIKPSVMAKSLHIIPDAGRRQLAIHQAFFMARMLLANVSDKFFRKYATLMAAIEDMEAETAFQQITGFDFEKFFALFKDWARTTNIWTAISD